MQLFGCLLPESRREKRTVNKVSQKNSKTEDVRKYL